MIPVSSLWRLLLDLIDVHDDGLCWPDAGARQALTSAEMRLLAQALAAVADDVDSGRQRAQAIHQAGTVAR